MSLAAILIVLALILALLTLLPRRFGIPTLTIAVLLIAIALLVAVV